jgi:hypothetical protein
MVYPSELAYSLFIERMFNSDYCNSQLKNIKLRNLKDTLALRAILFIFSFQIKMASQERLTRAFIEAQKFLLTINQSLFSLVIAIAVTTALPMTLPAIEMFIFINDPVLQ